MNVVVLPLFHVLNAIIELYKMVVIASAVFSWLIAFSVVNTRNRFVYTVMDTLYRLTEPVLRPIRRALPNMGGIDISPIILFFILWFVQEVLAGLVQSLLY